MQDRIFLLPTDATLLVAKLVIGDDFRDWAKRARHNHARLVEEDVLFDNLRYHGIGLDLSFVELSDECDEEVVEDVHGLADNVMLPVTVDPGWFKVIAGNPTEKCISVCHDGVTVSGGVQGLGIVTSFRLYWNEIGADVEDLVRCFFGGCKEAHPVAGSSELVTCHTCRKKLKEEE